MAAFIQADVPAPSARVLAIKGDTSYATGGYAVPGLVGTSAAGLDTGGSIIARWDAANQKVKFITVATNAEVSNASDQSLVTVKLLLNG